MISEDFAYFTVTQNELNLLGSKVSNATVSVKDTSGWHYLGKSDGQGIFTYVELPRWSIGDSLRIEANGYYPFEVAVDSFLLRYTLKHLPLFPKNISNSSSLFLPSVERTSPYFTHTNTADFDIKGNYITEIKYNKDSIWHIINGANVSIPLDTGLNEIKFQLINGIDTFLTKEQVYMYPPFIDIEDDHDSAIH